MADLLFSHEPPFKKKITKEQKEALGLLQIGTFLESFDVVLYIHMSVVLNALFFPKVDPRTQLLLAAFSFSITYFFRPFGALLFGFYGDWFGRKSIVVSTTLLMSFSSFVIACLPTYDQFGIAVSIAVILCRILQGISSSTEYVGAKIYSAEIIRPPHSYFYASLSAVASSFGNVFALFTASLVMFFQPENGWRYVFFLGSGVAMVGSVARTKLRETPEFMRERPGKKWQDIFKAVKTNRRNILSYFLIELINPCHFFVIFIFFGELLRTKFGYSPVQVVNHNLFVTIFSFISDFILCWLTKWIFPLRIIRFLSYFGIIVYVIAATIFLISSFATPLHVMAAQFLLCALGPVGRFPADAVFARGFDVIGRYSVMGTTYSCAKAFAGLWCPFIITFLGNDFGFLGVSGFMIGMCLVHLTGARLFIPCQEDKDFQQNWKPVTQTAAA